MNSETETMRRVIEQCVEVMEKVKKYLDTYHGVGELSANLRAAITSAKAQLQQEGGVAQSAAAVAELVGAIDSAVPFMQDAWKVSGIGGMFEVMDHARTIAAKYRTAKREDGAK